MSDRIAASLRRLFEEHRIVFWYDAAKDMRGEFELLDLPDVVMLEIRNDEFGLKYRMLRQEPETKFLVYKEDAEPPHKDNWLLDIQLATAVFRADQAAMWLAELELPAQFEGIVREHAEFYRAKTRLDALKRLSQPSDTQTQLRMRMLAVCVGAEGGLDTVIEALLDDLAEGDESALKMIDRSGLTKFLWAQVRTVTGYNAPAPDLEDFALSLFQSGYRRALGEDGALNTEAQLLFSRWKNNRLHAAKFEALSGRYQALLKIEDDLAGREIRPLIAMDHFDAIDRHLIRQIVHCLAERTVSPVDVLKWVRERRQSHWFRTYEDIYLAIGFATEFQQALADTDLSMSSPANGVKRYVTSWFRIDQLYRKFIQHMQKSGQASLLGELFETVENHYTSQFLLRLNDGWQDQVKTLGEWTIPGYLRQSDFYREEAALYRRKDQKVVVVVSDALRYEVAEELLREIRSLNRFDADLKPMIASLPSYTQLGMASLLPNKDLTLTSEGGVSSFGESTQGLPAREKILDRGRSGDRVKTLRFEDAFAMRTDEGKALFRDHDIVYIYHNRIDAIGDKSSTEGQLADAAADAIADLTTLVRKLTSANFSNILITADHGFLYQHRVLDESDFSIADPQGEAILTRNRRFVVGRGLNATEGMKAFTSAELGLAGDLDVLIPNSINRLRVKGASSRFVHGGAALQEIVIPVLRVGKKREADISQVEVQIIVAGKSLITSGQIAVTFYQAQPVSEKLQARELTAGIFAKDGTLISDEQEMRFDFMAANAREREIPRKFLLSRDADRYNNTTVTLKLRERVGKTSHYQDHASQSFELRRGITTDFDF